VQVNKELKRIEAQIETDMHRVAPNISSVAGAFIGARLISLAKGLERLASFPASTIQLLGAEKALFRFKHQGGNPPKHGVIFQHPLINRSPRKWRGKIARALATKISIAVKADVFTKRFIADDLKKDLEERVGEIRNL
jgi:nucleolar protein 56